MKHVLSGFCYFFVDVVNVIIIIIIIIRRRRRRRRRPVDPLLSSHSNVEN